MAIARDTTAKNIKPLEGAVIRRVTLGDTVAAGEIVALASDGKFDPAIATSITLAFGFGIAIQAGVDGDKADVVVFGPVKCLTGATKGALVFVSDTAGEPSETAGTKSEIIGMTESDTVLFVRPQYVALS